MSDKLKTNPLATVREFFGMSDPEVTLWYFSCVTELGHRALVEASKLTGETETETINKALQIEKQVYDVYQSGGSFGIQIPGERRPPTDKDYETSGNMVTTLKVNLSPPSLAGLLACADTSQTEDVYSPVLNRALQRWRDVLVAQTKGWQVFLQEAAKMPMMPVRYT